jgi:hypothetical protein
MGNRGRCWATADSGPPSSASQAFRKQNLRARRLDGPFTEAKEIIGGYAQLELGSKQEAIESAVRVMELHQKYGPGWEGETEVRAMMDGDCRD